MARIGAAAAPALVRATDATITANGVIAADYTITNNDQTPPWLGAPKEHPMSSNTSAATSTQQKGVS